MTLDEKTSYLDKNQPGISVGARLLLTIALFGLMAVSLILMFENTVVIKKMAAAANLDSFSLDLESQFKFSENYVSFFKNQLYKAWVFVTLPIMSFIFKKRFFLLLGFSISVLGIILAVAGYWSAVFFQNNGIIYSAASVYAFSDPKAISYPPKNIYICFKKQGPFHENCIKLACESAREKKADPLGDWDVVKLKSDNKVLGLKKGDLGYVVDKSLGRIDGFLYSHWMLVKFNYKDEDPFLGKGPFYNPDDIKDTEVESVCIKSASVENFIQGKKQSSDSKK